MSEKNFTQYTPESGDYDYGLGIDPEIISYIKESVVIESRISPIPCYLLQRNAVASSSIGSSDSPVALNTFSDTSPNYRGTIWASGSIHPDLRINADNASGKLHVYIDGVEASRVLEVDDLANDNEFAIVERIDLDPARIEVVFNEGFAPSTGSITYWYPHMNAGIRTETFKRGQSGDESLFGWQQYINNDFDEYCDRHQVLVRMPLTTRDLRITEEGKVALEENQSWVIWTPYIDDFDILIVPPSFTASGVEERYEVVNKQDSYIQRTLVSQRFKLKLLEADDPRYNINYVTTRV